MSHFVNPFTDIGFKIIFGQPASKPLLITLLNELLAGEHHIEDLTFLDKEDHSENRNDTGIIYDLYCRTESGEYIIVEMQNRWHSNFLDRTLYYVSRAISRQIEQPIPEKIKVHEDSGIVCEERVPYGKRYRLSTVYGVFLMNFKEQGLEAKFRTDTVIADRESNRMVNPHFRQIYLQFPYFTKELTDCTTLYDKLIYALKNMNQWNRMPDALKEQVFQRLDRLAAVANLSEADRIAYDKAVDSFSVNQIVMEDQFNKGIQKGLEEGIKKGIRKGREEGIKKGQEEGIKKGELRKQLEIALNLKRAGISVEQIAMFTGLSLEEVKEL